MSTNETPQVIMVPVKRYDVSLSLEDLLTPLTQTAASLTQVTPGAALDPSVAQHLQRLSELASQLRDVVTKINQLDPSILAPKPASAPPTTT